MQLALPLNHSAPSTSIFARNGFEAQVLRAGPDVGGATEALLQPAVAGVADHRGVEAGAGHDGEALAVELADVELAAVAAEPDRHRLLDVLRDAEIRGEEVRGAGGDDREAHARPREDVDAALHHAVAAPGEDELGALVERALHLRRRLLALRNLDPERVFDSLGLEHAA